MKVSGYLLLICSVSLVLLAESFHGVLPASSVRRIRVPEVAASNNRYITFLQGAPKSEDSRPTNEFSRTVPPEKVLKLSGKHHRGGSNRMPERQYTVDIDASPQECEALATRFECPAIEFLEASLSLSPEGNSGIESAGGILVQGTVRAKVIRTCVRTNEPFPVDLDFAIYSLVRPMPSTGSTPTLLDLDKKEVSFVELNRAAVGSTKSGKKSNKRDPSDYTEDSIDPAELLKMQSMLEDMIQVDEDVDDILMEDEYIYAIGGTLDVGELVSQLFWLELDPYPRKPGSEFLQYSISG